MSYFSIQNITKSYVGKTVLHPFNLELEKGEIISIVGETGSGKSTLLRIMAGLEVQDLGNIKLRMKEILNPSQKIVSGYHEIKLIHQDFHLYPNINVAENIARTLLHFDKEYAKYRLETVLKLLGLTEFRDRMPHQLSGGQQQKVAIAKALSVEPEILLLDEPFSSLDTIQKYRLIYELKEIFLKMGTTVIFVTHDLDDALRLTDELIILQKGKVAQKGNSKELCLHPKTRYVARLFSPINAIPERKNHFIRPSDLKLRTKGMLLGHVLESRFLTHFNSLQVRLKNSGEIWEVDDPLRKYQVGDRVYISFEEAKLLFLNS